MKIVTKGHFVRHTVFSLIEVPYQVLRGTCIAFYVAKAAFSFLKHQNIFIFKEVMVH
jgi:hypothetical protein